MSADQYRQTQSPDDKSKKARQDECEVKRRMTTHWDMDYLSREELEAEMARGFGHDRTDSTGRAEQTVVDNADGADKRENPLRIGVTLLILSVAMMVAAILLLRSGGN